MSLKALKTKNAVPDLGGIAVKFLAKGNGSGVLKMGASNFEDILEGRAFFRQFHTQCSQGGNQPELNGIERGQMKGRRHHIIAALAQINLIIGMDEFFARFMT